MTEEQVDNGSPDVWGEGSARKDLVERIILGSRDSSDCILAEYTDHTAITRRVRVLDLALPSNCDGLKTAVGVHADAQLAGISLGELLRRSVVEHQER